MPRFFSAPRRASSRLLTPWRVEPAALAGCKVLRQFEWRATSGRQA